MWSPRTSLCNASVFGLNGWRKPESVKSHFRAVVFGNSFRGYQGPWHSEGPCVAAKGPTGGRVRVAVPLQGPGGPADGKDLPSLLTVDSQCN